MNAATFLMNREKKNNGHLASINAADYANTRTRPPPISKIITVDMILYDGVLGPPTFDKLGKPKVNNKNRKILLQYLDQQADIINDLDE